MKYPKFSKTLSDKNPNKHSIKTEKKTQTQLHNSSDSWQKQKARVNDF